MKPQSYQLTQKLFLFQDGKFLVLRDTKSGQGDLPGGRTGEGEIYSDMKISLRRELAEELGEEIKIDIEPGPMFYFPLRMFDSGMEAIGFAYCGRLIEGEIRLSDEHNEMQWLSPVNDDPASYFSGYMRNAVETFLIRLRDEETLKRYLL